MTAHRRPKIAFTDAARGTCRWCGETILHLAGSKKGEVDRRRRWHPQCVDIYNASDPREVRRIIRKRDRGICSECRLDTYALRREVRGKGRTKKLRERGFKPGKSLWEVDHIVPLVDGGSFEPTNLQTLCTPCHNKKTALEARERARRGSGDREGSAAQSGQDLCPSEPEAPAEDRTREPGARGRGKKKASRNEDGPAGIDALLSQASAVNARAEALLESIRAERPRNPSHVR